MRTTNPRTEVVGGRSRRGGAVLAVVLAVCVLMLSAQAPARNRASGTVLQSWILSAAAPLLSALSWISRGATSGADSVREVFSARKDNIELKKTLHSKISPEQLLWQGFCKSWGVIYLRLSPDRS